MYVHMYGVNILWFWYIL